MARRHVVSRARGSRCQTSWFQGDIAFITQASAGSTIVYSLNAAALALRPFTIVRTHIQFMLFSDQEAAVEQQVCAFGLAVVSDQATAVGVTAVPTPTTEASSDLWFMHKYMFADAVNLTDRAIPSKIYTVDSKAMRRVDIGQDVVGVLERTSSGGGLILVTALRQLVKLH